MNIVQSADTIASSVTVDGNSVPVINKRQITGLIAVEDRSTIVLGGLIQDGVTKTSASIPILGDIPLLGRLFRSDNNTVTRTELLVLITPYVVKTPDEARAETKRLHLNSQMSESLIRGWSDSPFARTDPMIEKAATQRRSLFGKSTAPVTTNMAPATDATPATSK
jgi:type II secretory pathway component GspD/PulD (secretin)